MKYTEIEMAQKLRLPIIESERSFSHVSSVVEILKLTRLFFAEKLSFEGHTESR